MVQADGRNAATVERWFSLTTSSGGRASVAGGRERGVGFALEGKCACLAAIDAACVERRACTRDTRPWVAEVGRHF